MTDIMIILIPVTMLHLQDNLAEPTDDQGSSRFSEVS
jgi:hypothetical protein